MSFMCQRKFVKMRTNMVPERIPFFKRFDKKSLLLVSIISFLSLFMIMNTIIFLWFSPKLPCKEIFWRHWCILSISKGRLLNVAMYQRQRFVRRSNGFSLLELLYTPVLSLSDSIIFRKILIEFLISLRNFFEK